MEVLDRVFGLESYDNSITAEALEPLIGLEQTPKTPVESITKAIGSG